MNMPYDPSRINFSGRYEACLTEFEGLGFGDAKSTGGRFNLIPAERRRSDQFARDIIFPTQTPSGVSPQRRLVLDKSLVNMDMYQLLIAARVPVLEMVGETPHLAVFGVPAGAKLLRYEPRHVGVGSSPTYISDAEVYHEAGRLGGAAWQATGRVPVSDLEDSPTTSIAITSFSDEAGHYLYLCPPYDGLEAPTVDAARELFLRTLPNKMSAGALAHVEELLGAAAMGFGPLR